MSVAGRARPTSSGAARGVLLALLLAPPLLWLGVVYLGALVALLAQSFFSIDEFSGVIDRTFTLKTYAELLRPANLDIIVRTVAMAALVTLASIVDRLPDRLLRRPLRPRPAEGALLPRGDAAALVELPRQDLRLEDDPRQGGHRLLGGGGRCISAGSSTASSGCR